MKLLMTVKGYQPGKGAQFTPIHDANWTEEFNELLQEYNEIHGYYPRNRLTEKCVEIGVKTLKQGNEITSKIENSNGIHIPTSELSKEHIDFLNSDTGQSTVVGIIKMLLLGNPGKLTNFDPASQFEESNKTTDYQDEIQTHEAAASKEVDEPNDEEDTKEQINSFLNKIDNLGGI